MASAAVAVAVIMLLPNTPGGVAPALAASALGPRKPLRVLVLGDSYSAGVGAGSPIGNYYGPARCFRSHADWAEQYARSLETRYAVSVVNHACDGATDADVIADRKLRSTSGTIKGHAHDNSKESLARFVRARGLCPGRGDEDIHWTIDRVEATRDRIAYTCTQWLTRQSDFVGTDVDIVLLTLGADELGLSKTLKQCFVRGDRTPSACRHDVARAESALGGDEAARLTKALEAISARLNSAAKIVLVSYPYFVRNAEFALESRVHHDRYAAGAAVRDLEDHLDAVERKVVLDYNKKSPTRPEAVFVDTTKSAFAGHEPDGNANDHLSNRWIMSYADTRTVAEWFHPNPLGDKEWSSTLTAQATFGFAPSAARSDGPPIAHLAGPFVRKVGATIVLDASGSYDPGGSSLNYEWDVDGNGRFGRPATQARVTQRFASEEDVVVKVRVTNVRHQGSVATTRVRITPDGDAIPAGIDNCPSSSNPDQRDANHNHVGDVCDSNRLFPAADPNGVEVVEGHAGGFSNGRLLTLVALLAVIVILLVALGVVLRARRSRTGAVPATADVPDIVAAFDDIPTLPTSPRPPGPP